MGERPLAYDKWQVDAAEFQGWAKAYLEAIVSRLDELNGTVAGKADLEDLTRETSERRGQIKMVVGLMIGALVPLLILAAKGVLM